jgi:hypothetical protein
MPQSANTISPQTYLGTAISWALGTLNITVGGVNPGFFQTADNEMGVDAFTARDQRGNVAQWTGYNPNDQATCEYVFATSGSYDSGTAALTYPTQGTMVTVGADASDPLSGSNWIVESVTIREANTDAKKCQLKLHRWQGVTQ